MTADDANQLPLDFRSPVRHDEMFVITANDVLLSETLTNFVLTHPGNLAFCVLCQKCTSELPPNGEPANLGAAARRMFDAVQDRGGRFIRLRKQSPIPEAFISRDETVKRLIYVLETVRAIRQMEEAMQLSVPELLFSLSAPSFVSPSPGQPNKFPLSYWFRKQWDDGTKSFRLSVAAPEIPSTYVQGNGISQPFPGAATSPTPVVTRPTPAASLDQAPTFEITKERIEDGIPANASSIFHIFDRRVNLDKFFPDASLYSLMRAWVQDDPHRVIPPAGIEPSSYEGRLQPVIKGITSSHRSRPLKKQKVDVLSVLSTAPAPAPPAESIRSEIVENAKTIRRAEATNFRRCQEQARKGLLKRGIML